MANTVIGATVQVEFESVGSMRKAIKDATSELIAMQEQFGKTSPQAIAAAQRIAQLKDRIQDAKEQADLFDPGKKFQAFANAASTVAAGFSAVQGAMALVGEESEDLQKTLVKVQGAMALAQGLSAVKDAGKAFDEMKVVAVNAFRAIKGAIGSTGIGLLVIALGTIVTYWDEIKEAVTGVSNEQKKLVADANAKATAAERELDILERSGETLKASGKTEKEIIQAKLTRLATVIKEKEIELAGIKAIKEATIAQAERYNKIIKTAARVGTEVTTAALRAIAVPLQITIDAVNLVSDTLGFGKIAAIDLQSEITKMNEFAASSVANLIIDPKELKDDINKRETELEDAIINAKEKQANYNKSLVADNKSKNEKISTQDKKAAEEDRKRKEEADKEAAAKRKALALKRDKEFTEEINKIIEETRLAGIKDLREKERAELAANHQEQLLAVKNNENATFEQRLALTIALRQKQRQEELALQQKFDQEDLQKKSTNLLTDAGNETTAFEQRLKLIQDRKALENQIIFASDEERAKFIKENEEATTKVLSDQYGARVQLAKAVGDALGGLTDVVGKETAAGKALAIAQATINTFLGITEVWKSKAVLPEPFNTATKIAATVTTAAGGFAAVRNIAKTKVPGAGGGGGPTPPPPGNLNAPMQPVLSPAVQGQALNAQAINDLGNQSLRAYVMNSDIQNNNQRNAYLQRNARIG